MKTIMISGGAGYLGTSLTLELLKKYKVVVYDKFYFPWLLKNETKLKNKQNIKFIKKDISEVNKNDFKEIDIVCDLNGISNDPSSEIDSRHTWKINYFYRLKFAKLAKSAGVKRYIFNSTCSVYGFNKKKVFENSKKSPISTYAKANFKAENEIFSLRNNNFKVNSLRNSTLFGFSNVMRLDLVINIFVMNLSRKKTIYIDGDGSQYRPFIAIKDICKIYEIIINKKNMPSFICNLVSFNSKISDLAFKISKILKTDKKLIKFKKNFSDKRNYLVGSRNFYKYFGKNFKFSTFSKEIKILKRNILKYNIKIDQNTIRMKFYKKKLI